MMKKTSLLGSLCFLLTASMVMSSLGQSWAQGPKLINNANKLPNYSQYHNYSSYYSQQNTDINTEDYDNLPAIADLVVNPNTVDEWYVEAPSVHRSFNRGDLTDITNGTYHCYPTAAAMILEYWASDRGFPKLGRGTLSEDKYISAISAEMDTNDFHLGIRTNDDKGHFATFNSMIGPGVQSYVGSKDGTVNVNHSLINWNAATYKAEINANRPAFLIIATEGNIGHGVVGIGYDDKGDADPANDEVIYRDPAESGTATKRVKFSNITPG